MCKSCRTCFKFYCRFYFTCDRSFSCPILQTLHPDSDRQSRTIISIKLSYKHTNQGHSQKLVFFGGGGIKFLGRYKT